MDGEITCLRVALSFMGKKKKKLQAKTESELTVFLEIKEGLKFTQFTVILFSFADTRQKGKGEKE